LNALTKTLTVLAVLAGTAQLALTSARAQVFPPVPGSSGSAPATSPFPDPRTGTSGGFPAPPSASPFPAPGTSAGGAGGFGPPRQAGENPCVAEFAPLRAEAERRAGLVKAASNRRAQPAEACKLITNFANAEAKMVRFMDTKAKSCGIPPEIPTQIKKNHAGTQDLRKRICEAANAPRGPAGPTLSEALGAPSLPEAAEKRSGGSTFDTLTGNVLAR
jgi:hypothetical protein